MAAIEEARVIAPVAFVTATVVWITSTGATIEALYHTPAEARLQTEPPEKCTTDETVVQS